MEIQNTYLKHSPKYGRIMGKRIVDLSTAAVTILGFVLFGAIVVFALRNNYSPLTTELPTAPVNTPVSLDIKITFPENGSSVCHRPR